MASVPSGRDNGGSKGFDFGSDDILCSYEEDNTNRDSSNGTHIDPAKDFHVSRMGRTSIVPAIAYSSPEHSLSQDVIATVEKSMKTYADNLMRFLEGLSSRLSQLELYCYNLDKSIGAMRSDLNSDHEEADSKLKSLDKHLQEVRRSVQILRDKQELAETQKELAKLQLVRKESSSSSHSQSNEERSSPSMDPKRMDNASDKQNQELALALPHQVAPRQQPVAVASSYQAAAPNVSQATQQPHYYIMPTPLPNPQVVAQLPQNQYLPSDPQFRIPQSTSSSQVTQSPPVQQFPQYQQQLQHHHQQQWPQQLPQQVQPPQPPSMQSQMRPPLTNIHTPYSTSQATNPLPTETPPNSMPMQMPYSGIPSRGDAMPYGYGGAGRTVQQQPLLQHMKGSFSAQPGDVYGTSRAHGTPPPASSYMVYDGESGRAHYPPQSSHYGQSGYPPTSASVQNPAPHNLMIRSPSQSQFVRSHPYNELIEKFVSMGFRGDHVVSIIQRMEETRQPVDFNSVLDRLNVHNPQRGWSG
ncbi:hypothetical protein CR513_37239 [Mucuna pruriens]|uniref:DUF1421 domain-containing protein n=1 Tax=Mucuna pruriens TaxID=157652 RepID=A0A371FUI8_MUCPR|nr:hypothetical protein CR513_37239 [Mucuna pruriens]